MADCSPCLLLVKGSGAKVLISRHRDGEFIARVIRYFGLGTIRGSYGKRSVSQVREMLAELKEGTDIAITPDGPKGPRYQMKQGIVELARLSRQAHRTRYLQRQQKETF